MDADDTNSLLKAYAISAALLYVHYFYSQITSLDPKSHLAEDNTLVAKDIDKLDLIEAGGDDAAKDQVNKMLLLFFFRWTPQWSTRGCMLPVNLTYQCFSL